MRRYGSALVLGFGASGESAARLLLREGARVTVVDEADDPGLRARAAALACDARLGVHELPDGEFEVAIASPGVRADGGWMGECARRALPVLPEFELGWSRFAGRTVAITGTNGKSTMTKWARDALALSGRPAAACGNIGVPVCDAVQGPGIQWLVMELSSFQLERAREFRADFGVLLNLLPNHLDRHGTMENYARAKAKLFAHTRAGDVCVAHGEALGEMRKSNGTSGAWISFGSAGHGEVEWREGRVARGGETIADLRGTYFDNPVLGENAAAVSFVLRKIGLTSSEIRESAQRFEPLPHRMELVAEKNGVRFVNDSKATTLAAVSAGVRMCGGKVRLIAGGLLKESDLSSIKKVLAERASCIYLIGRASNEMLKAWSGSVECVSCGRLDDAVQRAWRDAEIGETVLLSPGCASFDQFRNYAERGERFKVLVKELTGEKSL